MQSVYIWGHASSQLLGAVWSVSPCRAYKGGESRKDWKTERRKKGFWFPKDWKFKWMCQTLSSTSFYGTSHGSCFLLFGLHLLSPFASLSRMLPWMQTECTWELNCGGRTWQAMARNELLSYPSWPPEEWQTGDGGIAGGGGRGGQAERMLSTLSCIISMCLQIMMKTTTGGIITTPYCMLTMFRSSGT